MLRCETGRESQPLRRENQCADGEDLSPHCQRHGSITTPGCNSSTLGGIFGAGGLLAILVVWCFLVGWPQLNENASAGALDVAGKPVASTSSAAASDPAGESQPSFIRSRPESGPEFELAPWVEAVGKIDHATWNRHHPGPYSGWFDGESDNCAKQYFITWGPLGIRTLMHDHTWGTYPAFRRAWPAGLLDARGELLFDCFEIVDVIPGSPADGHLHQGDLLIAMDGKPFVTAAALHPDQPERKHQGSRSLAMDAGERLDVAEGRGRIAFDVIRPADGQSVPTPAEPFAAATRESQITGEMRLDALTEVELDAPVSAGDELTARFELTRKHNGSCAANLIRPRLEGPAGTLDLSETRRLSQASGWGHIRRGADNSLKPITYHEEPVANSLWIHAPGHLTWIVPKGYDRFRATVVCTRPAEGYRVRVLVRGLPGELPSSLKPLHQVVAFDIPRLGTYGAQAPTTADAKSALVARMTAAWLAGQQQADGSWKRTCGYTHNGYDTAWAGLGLLAQADPAYDGQIRQAAEFLAFHASQDGWAVPSAMAVIFLSEYWLRTHDDRVLVALQSQMDRIRNEMVYGDWNSGHGHNPGYRGSGVSIGGSHVTLALAVASLTPVKAEPELVDRMLARAQELAPSGFIPYGRESGVRAFTPELEEGGTYSGRHAPYLIASLIHGGPRLFTDNCSAMYARGALGGIDQGHATQSMTTNWGLLAASMIDTEVLQRHWAALAWKLTLLRCHDGGFCQNSYKLEYQGGEGLLPNYLRSGAYLVILNATKRNLAITGAPQWRAKELLDVPPVCHEDAVALRYYQRNWGVANEVLGDRAPQRLRDGLGRLLAMGKGSETRAELYDFLKTEAAPTARELLALDDVPTPLRPYLAEMVLGVDVRITAELDADSGTAKPADGVGRWKIELDVQHPLAGYFVGATPEERTAWRKNPPLPMQGQVEILSKPSLTFPIQPDCGGGGWQTVHLGERVDGPASGPVPWVARFRYKVGDMAFAYNRPIVAGGEEPGNGEKGRKVLNDRIVWVKGRLQRDLNAWNASFLLPSGQFISAATQGVASQASYRGSLTWVSSDAGAVPAGTECEFGFTSGWQPYEARIASLRIPGKMPVISLKQLTANGSTLERKPLQDFDRKTAQKLTIPADAQQPLNIEADLPAAATVRGVDVRLSDSDGGVHMTVEVEVNGQWQIVFQGRPGNRLSAFPPIETRRVRVRLSNFKKPGGTVELQEFHLIRAAKPQAA